jgi:hypothetical protein
MQKMGFQQGGRLGRTAQGPAAPILLDIRGSRSGLGVHEQKKRALEQQQQHARLKGDPSMWLLIALLVTVPPSHVSA